jgi:hypothetical protein
MRILPNIGVIALLTLFPLTGPQASESEQYFCVILGDLHVMDFNEKMPIEGRKIRERVSRSKGDGSGFKLTLFQNKREVEMDFKVLEHDYKAHGEITFHNSSHTNVTFDYNESHRLGLFPHKPSSTLVTIILSRPENTFFRSHIISDGSLKMGGFSGGKCNKM